MFFFFPFAENLIAAPATVQPATLPMLPAPARRAEKQGKDSFADVVSYAGVFGNDLIRKMIGLLTSSLTVVGSRANEFFSYISAWLLFDRMMRQAHSMMAMGFQAFGLAAPQPYAGMPAPFFPFSAPFKPGFGATPVTAFADMFTPWINVWGPARPAQAPQRPARETIPLTFGFSMPGFAWSVSAG